MRYKFSKLKIKEIRKNLYEIENEKNLSESKIIETEKNLTELEENLSKIKKYNDYDDNEYRRIRNVRDLFDFDEPRVLLMSTIFSMEVRETKEKIYH